MTHKNARTHSHLHDCLHFFIHCAAQSLLVFSISVCKYYGPLYIQRTTNMKIMPSGDIQTELFTIHTVSCCSNLWSCSESGKEKLTWGYKTYANTTHAWLKIYTNRCICTRQDLRNSQWMKQFTGVLPVFSPADISGWDSGRLWLVSMHFLTAPYPSPPRSPFPHPLTHLTHSYVFSHGP